MDLVICIFVSLVEMALLPHLTSFTRDPLIKTIIILTVCHYFILKAFYIFLWPHYFSPLRTLPGPKGGNVLLGQTLNQAKALPSELEISWMKDCPEAPFIRYLWLFNTEVLLVNNTRAQKEVLQTKCYAFKKPGYYERIVGEIAGHGLLFAEGEEHRKHRKLLIEPFSFGNIKRLLPFFQSKAEETTSIISNHLERGETTVEVSGLLAKTTLDIIGLAALGYELNSLSTSSRLAESYEKIFECVTPLQILISVVNQFVPIRAVLPIEANRKFTNANAEVRQILREHIRKRKKEFEEGKFTGEKVARDLLTLMIEEAGDHWTEDEMLGFLLNFMSAGHETTAGSLTWALYASTLHPELQSRLRSEINAKINFGKPTQQQIESMPLLNNFTREVLRFYPPSPNFPREAAVDVEIEGVRIPKGTIVMIAPAAPHFNQDIWGPDADLFNPDRWDSLPEQAQDPYASVAFSNGPRVCIGKSFALLEFKTILTELLRHFRFENTGPVEPQKSGPTLRPLNGMMLEVARVTSELEG